MSCSSRSAWHVRQMWQVIHPAEDDHNRRCVKLSPRAANPSWLWKPSEWWIPSRSLGGTWQTWASSLSPVCCVSIPCRSPDRTEPRWCWSRSIRPGTPAEEHPGIFQTTTAHSLRVHPGVGSVRPGLEAPCPALHPRLAWQDPLDFTGSTWSSAFRLFSSWSGKHQETLTAVLMR